MTRQCRPRRRTLGRFADDGLGTRVPMPQENGAVFRAGRDVAVGCNVAFGSTEASDNAEMTVHDLRNFGYGSQKRR